MRVAVIGAGVSGLAAARDLATYGHDVVVYEKSRGVGGRAATRRRDGFVWDTGATSIAPRGKRIEKVMLQELDGADLVRIEKPIYVHHNLRTAAGDPRKNVPRYVYRNGISTFAKLLAEGLDVRLECSIDALGRDGDRYVVADEVFDGVILTPPVPQTSLLLWSIGESRPFANVRYRSSLSVMVGFAAPTPPVPYFALIDADQRHPMVWLSLESAKSPGRSPDGMSAFVVQMSPGFSFEYYERDDIWLSAVAAEFVEKIYGNSYSNMHISDVMRWKYAAPEQLASFENVNPPGARLIVTGDGFFGGRIEDAFESGLRASELLRATS